MAVSCDSNTFWFCKVPVKDQTSLGYKVKPCCRECLRTSIYLSQFNSLFLSTTFKTWSLRFDDQNSNPLRWNNWHMWGIWEAVITHNRPTVLFESKAKPGLGVSSQHKLLLWDPGDQPYWKTLVNYSSDKCSRTPMHEANLVYRGVHQGPLELSWSVWAALGGLSPG